MTVLDWILLAFVGVGLVAGVVRGLARELVRTICYAVSALTAWMLCMPLGIILHERLKVLQGNQTLLAFILIFLATSIVLWLIRLLLRSFGDFSFNGMLERLGGGLVGGVKNLVAGLLLLLFSLQTRPNLSAAVALNTSFAGAWVESRILPQYQTFAEKYPRWYSPPSWGFSPEPEVETDDAEQGNDRGDSQPE